MYALKQVATEDVLFWQMDNGWVGGKRRRGGGKGRDWEYFALQVFLSLLPSMSIFILVTEPWMNH